VRSLLLFGVGLFCRSAHYVSTSPVSVAYLTAVILSQKICVYGFVSFSGRLSIDRNAYASTQTNDRNGIREKKANPVRLVNALFFFSIAFGIISFSRVFSFPIATPRYFFFYRFDSNGNTLNVVTDDR